MTIAIPGKMYKHLATGDKYECKTSNKCTETITLSCFNSGNTITIGYRDFYEKFSRKQ